LVLMQTKSSTPLTDKLCEAKDLLREVMERCPEEACGSGWLEQAIGLVGQAESEVEPVEEGS
jgi:hypothetical protein